MKKAKQFLAITLVFASFAISAQPTIYENTYDDNGNRTTREVIFLGTYKTNNNSNQDNSSANSEVSVSYLLTHQISIYPNPTLGNIKIDITGLEEKTGFVRVFNTAGKELLSQNISEENRLDLSNEASGNYILQIEIEGKTREWKIVKQ